MKIYRCRKDRVVRVLGPYLRKPPDSCAGRNVIHLVRESGRRECKLYSRYLMEKHLGYTLSKDLHVHHKNENYADDRLENLEVVDAKEHSKRHFSDLKFAKWNSRGWAHGTIDGYQKKKCRCAACTQANAGFNAKRRERRSPSRIPGAPSRNRGNLAQHGETVMYKRGCRCEECKAAANAYARKLKQKKRLKKEAAAKG